MLWDAEERSAVVEVTGRHSADNTLAGNTLLRLREMHNALQLPVFFLFFCQPYPEYRGIRSEKLILQAIKQLILYMVLGIINK